MKKSDSKQHPLVTASIPKRPPSINPKLRMRLSINLFLFLSLFSIVSSAKQIQTPNLGQTASPALIKSWDRDIFPNGHGLPIGSGSAKTGKKIYQKYCQLCHGFEGRGASADELAGAQHSLTDDPPDKIIGTYWPYATTLFDFIRRSMPLTAPGTLSNDEVYAVTAYLLYLNGIIKVDEIMNHKTLAQVKMPNRDGFINIYEQEEQ